MGSFLAHTPEPIKNMKVYDSFGIPHNSQDILAADRLLKLKRDLSGTEANGVWEVIGECIKLWIERHPDKWQSYLVDLKDVKETRTDKFALSREGGRKGTLRYTLDFPEPLMRMIRIIYSPDELPMDRDFFLRFARKFPLFKVAEKI